MAAQLPLGLLARTAVPSAALLAVPLLPSCEATDAVAAELGLIACAGS